MVQKREGWRAALPGLVIVGAMLAIAIFTLTYARIGALRGPTHTVFLPVNEARGVIRGTDVWLAGQRVGQVAAITFRPAETDTTERVLLELQVKRQYSQHIRRDSYADIRSGGTLLGAPVVSIATGTPAAAPLSDGDTLRRAEQRELRDMATELASLGGEFREIATNVRTLRDRFAGLEKAAGAIERDRQRVAEVLTRRLLRRPLGRQAGALRLLAEDEELGARLERIAAGYDSVVAALAAPRGTVGNLTHQDALQPRLDSLSLELDEISRLLRGGHGTAGRVLHDRALLEGIESLREEIRLLREDAARWPARYFQF